MTGSGDMIKSIHNTITAVMEQKVYERKTDVNHRRILTNKNCITLPKAIKARYVVL